MQVKVGVWENGKRTQWINEFNGNGNNHNMMGGNDDTIQ
jgi:hypothetical protein